MASTPAKTVHMAVYDTWSDWEVGFATAHINSGAWQRDPGSHRVLTVGESREPVTSAGGMRILPDVTLDDLRPADSAMLILPGADTWLTGGNGAFAAKARDFLDAGVPVAAICGATMGLAVEGAAGRSGSHEQRRGVPRGERLRRWAALPRGGPGGRR